MTAHQELIRRGVRDPEHLEEDRRRHGPAGIGETSCTRDPGGDPRRGIALALELRRTRRIARPASPGVELAGRFGDPRDANLAGEMIAVQEEEYEALWAFLLAIGRFGEARGNDGKSLGRLLAQFPLLAYARQSLDEDAFFRDGITRGLERLGPVALDVLARPSGRERPRSRARRCMPSRDGGARWPGRADEHASSDDPIPGGLARPLSRLREMVADVPAEPLAAWLADMPNAPAEARVSAIRVLKAIDRRAVLAVGPVLPTLLTADDGEVRKAALELAVGVRTAEATSRSSNWSKTRPRGRGAAAGPRGLAGLRGQDAGADPRRPDDDKPRPGLPGRTAPRARRARFRGGGGGGGSGAGVRQPATPA